MCRHIPLYSDKRAVWAPAVPNIVGVPFRRVELKLGAD